MPKLKTLIRPEALAEHLHDPEWVIMDCRFDLADPGAGRKAYHSAHIPGAVYMHLDEDLAGTPTAASGRHPLPDPDNLAKRLGSVGVGPATSVVAYDDASGAIAARAWWLLKWLGHDRVAVLDGGLKAWRKGGFPVDAEPVTPRPKTFVSTVQHGAWVSTHTLQQHLRNDDCVLLDARAPARYLGETEPLDKVAGHIPGAVNHPFSDNLDAEGRFLAADVLRARYEASIGNTKKQVICMCGSGVTACHSLLALEIAGIGDGKLYAGSWSEWIQDPARPVISRHAAPTAG